MHGLTIAICGLLLVSILQPPVATASSQRYVVSGKFLCGKKASPGSETAVKLLDKNIGPDTNMGKMKVNNDGTFRIDGTSSAITSIDPELHIYTDCDDGIVPCQRKWKLKLPKKYIGDVNGIDIGTYNLEVIFKDEERDCFH